MGLRVKQQFHVHKATSYQSIVMNNIALLTLQHYDNMRVNHFYRAMHFSAKRGIAIACRLSVRPSVCDVGEL